MPDALDDRDEAADFDGGATQDDDADPVLAASDPLAVYGAILHLSYLRSCYLIGQRLAALCPTEADWLALQREPVFLESVEELAVVIAEMRSLESLRGVYSPDAIEAAVAQHYGRSLECVELLAERLDCPPVDLLAVLVHAQ